MISRKQYQTVYFLKRETATLHWLALFPSTPQASADLNSETWQSCQ
jgi:hypothetical protein